MKIDIREDTCQTINSIQFNDFGWVDLTFGNRMIDINNNDNASYKLLADKSQIDNLIKALQKAKELWCE